MNKRCQRSSRSGFTLIEVMVSLVIVLVAFLVIEMTMGRVHHRSSDESSTAFYLYLNAIEDRGYCYKDDPPGKLILNKDHKQYYVRLVNNQLVMSTTRGGYMPLLKNVRSVEWDYHDRILTSHVVMNHGAEFTGKSRLNGK